MNKKIIIGLVILTAILISSIAVVSAADVEIKETSIIRQYTTKSDSSSQAVYTD